MTDTPPSDGIDPADEAAFDRAFHAADGLEAMRSAGSADVRAGGISVGPRRRSLLSSLALYAPVAYAGAVVLRDSPHPFFVRLVGVIAALVTVARLSPAIDDLHAPSRSDARLTLIALVVAALLSFALPEASRSHAAEAITVLSAVVAAAAALRCAAGIPGLGGLGASAPGRLSVLTRRGALRRIATLAAATWILSGVLQACRALASHEGRLRSALAFVTDLGAELLVLNLAVIAVTVVLLIAARRLRRFELGALERHELLLGATALAMPAAILITCAFEPLDTTARASMILIAPALALSVSVLVAQLVRDPVSASTVIAHAWIALVFGAIAWGMVVVYAPHSSSLVGPVTIGLGVVVGVSTSGIAAALGLVDARLEPVRQAIALAREGAAAIEGREVHRSVLTALRALSGAAQGGVPRLFTFTPMQEIVLDAAGEPRTRDPATATEILGGHDAHATQIVPRELLELLVTEPLGVVRVEVLEALEVRRPDLRAALRWCTQRDAAAVIALFSDGDLEGVLVLPRGRFTRALGLLHVRALRAVATLTSTRIGLDSALTRASARAHVAERRTRDVEHALDLLSDDRARMTNALRGTSGPLAAKVELGGYAPSSRALRTELDALASTPHNVLLLHRAGTDPAPYAARLHRQSSRRGAFVVVDAARPEGQDVARWNDPVASPIGLARDGTLLVASAHRLPPEAQRAILKALAFRTAPGNDPAPIDLRLVLAIATPDPMAPAETLLSSIEPPLLGRMREPPLRIPKLSERGEDLRAICLDRLSALGISLRGEPFGVSDEALSVLVDYAWPGDDAELEAVLIGAATLTAERAGRRVEGGDLRNCHLGQPMKSR